MTDVTAADGDGGRDLIDRDVRRRRDRADARAVEEHALDDRGVAHRRLRHPRGGDRREVPPGNGASAGDWRITAPPVATLTVESDEAATTPTMSAAPVPSPSIGPV